MKFYILAPANITSGGPELAHQMCHELLQLGHYAQMYYITDNQKEPTDAPCPDKYLKYGTTHVTDISEVESKDSVIIVPEGTTPWLQALNNCYKVLWWMSVDNYISATNEANLPELKQCVNLHLVQSHYAYNYLINNVGIKEDNILYVSDYIGDIFRNTHLSNEYRKDIALYNPKKGYENIIPLINKVTWLKWIPLINLTEEQLSLLMQVSKIYVDFGSHPGKDRIPREAASCGCCVITNKEGSAAYYEDVPINDIYKYDNPCDNLDTIELLMKDICSHFDEHYNLFENYREIIRNERLQFTKNVKEMIEYITHNLNT